MEVFMGRRERGRELRRLQRRKRKLRKLKARLANANDPKEREILIEKIQKVSIYPLDKK
ncbi:MAG: DUF6800 family protein [Chloroflexota bacterium]